MDPANPTLSQDLDVDFQHWRVMLDEGSLQFGSRYYEVSRARKRLLDVCRARGVLVGAGFTTTFRRDQIHLANEVFPEAAVADPLADLEVLDEWRSGVRIFPYPGQYSRLELAAQEGKGPSTSSVGVVGEIMAGLFAQAGISPWIIVRVVGHWPDFIFYNPREERYAFVEAKAFTTSLSLGSGLLGRVHESLLIAEEIGRIASAVLSGKEKDGEQRPFYEGRRIAAHGGTAVIRMLGKDAIFMKDLNSNEIDRLEHRWQNDWRRAPSAHEGHDGGLAWRFGGALYWLGEPPLARAPG